MNPEILIYSMVEDMTYSELKNLDSEKIQLLSNNAQKIKDMFQKNNIKACIMGENDFHCKFHNILNTPYIMHYIGDLSLLDRSVLGIVGPRKPSQYSFKVLKNMFEYAQNYDFVTISGMAEGVDQLCHSFSVKYNIPTIAVLGGGILHFLKGPNRYIVDTIVQNGGLVLSEYKINFKPTKYSFPQRNRIISGLSDLLFLPEAGEKSGSLITADFAYQQNKPIYVTPNDIFSTTSRGVHQLISDKKANIVVNFEKFFLDHFIKKSDHKKEINLDLPPEEKVIIDVLRQKGELDLANLINETNIDANNIMNYLTMLEINKYICQRIPGVFSIIIEG